MDKIAKNNTNKKVSIIFVLIMGIIFFVVSPWLFIFAALVFATCIIYVRRRNDNATSAQISNEPLKNLVENEIRIMNDCVAILNTSKNIETVINRYNDLLAVLKRLSKYESNPAVSFPRELPSSTLVRIQGEKAQIMNAAIQRAYDDVLHKCAALKTEKGRKNRHMRFFDELNALSDNFPSETKEFLVEFINKNINDPLTGLDGL